MHGFQKSKGMKNQRGPGLGRDYSTKNLVLTFSPFAAMHLQMRPRHEAAGCSQVYLWAARSQTMTQRLLVNYKSLALAEACS